jgi:hypothetical protein
MTDHDILERIEILQHHTLGVLQEYFQEPHQGLSETSLALQQAMQYFQNQKGFWEKLTESTKRENVKRSVSYGVYQKYRNLLQYVQEVLPELYQQHQGIVFNQEAAPESICHAVLNDIAYIKRWAEHVIERKTYIDAIGKEGIFFAGQAFDAWLAIASILESAQHELVIIDSYIDAKVIKLMGGLSLTNSIKIVMGSTHLKNDKKRREDFLESAKLFNNQSHSLSVKISDEFHDRFVLVDESFFYHLGASINQAGVKKGFMFSRIEEQLILEALHQKFLDIWANAETFVES